MADVISFFIGILINEINFWLAVVIRFFGCLEVGDRVLLSTFLFRVFSF